MTAAAPASTWRFLARRGLTAAILVAAIIVLNFILIHSAPGDPVYLLAGDFATPEYYAAVRQVYGLDRPILEQLFRYLGEVLRGNLGFSYAFQQPTLAVIFQRLLATILLTGTAITLAATLGILLGVVASMRPRSLLDNLITAGIIVGYSVPVFWLAQILLLVFALGLGWFPAQGMYSFQTITSPIDRVADLINHLTLPAASLTAYYLALVIRITRAKMLEALKSEYILTARAKGLPFEAVVFQHALRNAVLPVITVIGYNFGLILAGSVLTETVFAWPGMGRLIFDAVYARDYPLLMASFIVIGVCVIFFNLLTDLIYGAIDPRIRYT